MSTSYGNTLPGKFIEALGAENAERRNSAIFILSSDREGFPHVALLSPYQVVASGAGKLLIAVHEGTRTQQYLEDSMKATIIVQLEPAVEYVKCRLEKVHDWNPGTGEALYAASIHEVLEDYSDKAPFVSELLFDQNNIFTQYSAGFQNIRKYALSH